MTRVLWFIFFFSLKPQADEGHRKLSDWIGPLQCCCWYKWLYIWICWSRTLLISGNIHIYISSWWWTSKYVPCKMLSIFFSILDLIWVVTYIFQFTFQPSELDSLVFPSSGSVSYSVHAEKTDADLTHFLFTGSYDMEYQVSHFLS